MYNLSTSCLIFFFLSLFHPFPCASRKQLVLCHTLFQCGNITAGFPFWGRNRHEHCGHPLLELHCNKDNRTSLIISDQEYYVLHIDHTSHTLTLVRADMVGPFCSAKFNTTTLPPDIFEISPTYKSLNVFYCCDPFIPHLSSYTCPEKNLISVSENPEYRQTCLGNFTVNVPTRFNITKEKKLNIMTNLESVLRKGFEVKLKIDKIACRKCSSSYGRCSYNETVQLGAKCGPFHPPTDEPHNHTCGSRNKDTCLSIGAKAGIGAVSFAMMGVIMAVACLFYSISRRKKRSYDIRRKTSDDQSRTTSDDPRQQYLKALIPLKHYSYVQVEKTTKSFAEVVGKGGFGTVYRGILCDGRSVAVKILKESPGNGEDFINEVASMSKTSHVNIVTLLGFCSEGSKRAIIYEFMKNGSLDKFISSKRSSNMDWGELYRIALGVARGLEYLHYGCRTRIVHFDIKPQNVLLDDNLCPKVSDFGLAKLCEKKESILSLLGTRGTIGYIAPELFSRMYGRVSHKSDVYSYGMLVLEMIGARNKTSTEDSASNPSSMYFPEWIYKDLEKEDNGRLIDNGTRSEEEGIAKKMTVVGLWCIQSCPSNRPSMNKVVEMMEGSLSALEVPPKPNLENPASPVQESSTISEDISAYTEVCSINVA